MSQVENKRKRESKIEKIESKNEDFSEKDEVE
jgi:hypothetical protein